MDADRVAGQPGLEATQSPALPSPAQEPETSIDPNTMWYLNAYSEAQLKTFHCEKVRKMPLSGLDPSMLLGFLCKDEREFDDFCVRVSKVSDTCFSFCQ